MANIESLTQTKFAQLSAHLGAYQHEGFLGIGQSGFIDGVFTGVYARGDSSFDRHRIVVDFIASKQAGSAFKAEYSLHKGELTVNEGTNDDDPSVVGLARVLGGLTLDRVYAEKLGGGPILQYPTDAEVDFLDDFLRNKDSTGADFRFFGDGSSYAPGIEFWHREDIRLPRSAGFATMISSLHTLPPSSRQTIGRKG